MKTKYGILMGITSLISLLMCSCASPDQEIIGKTTDHQNNISEYSGQTDASGMKTDIHGSSEKSSSDFKLTDQINSENGRHISVTYGSEDDILQIDADVVIPDGELLSGMLVPKEMDISLIEKYLCDGNALYAKSDGTSYISDSNEAGTDLGSDYIFSLISGGATFTNYKLDEYFTGFSIQQIPPSQQNEDQKSFVSDMEQKTQELFNQLSIESKISHSWLSVGDANSYCCVFVNAFLNDFALVSKDYGNFIQSNVTIAKQGINGAFFDGLYEIGESQGVSVLPLDTVLSMIEEDIENGNINTYENAVENITLAYMVEKTDHISFYPVWCFSGKVSETSGIMPFLCINARTGDIELMSSF